ncbi:MAG: GGDEF domain-containing protein [Patescibacteria group bacterium]|nr:GGDEF domain-containing protein [Patescibacteria group bacterium]
MKIVKFFKTLFFVFSIGTDETLKRIKYFSFDDLTGLYNRRGIKDIRDSFSLVFIDLDNFKVINDSLGYKAGDQILKRFSDILKKISRSTDLFIRWGGDEFVLILPKTNSREAGMVIDRIKKEVKRKGLKIKFSYGITQKEEAEEKEMKVMIEQASCTMQTQKQK